MARIKRKKTRVSAERNLGERRPADRQLLVIVFILVAIGLMTIASAGVLYGQTRFSDEYFFFKRQLLFGVFPGVLFMFVTQRIGYQFWRKISIPFFLATLICLLLVFVPGLGAKIYGASRWLQIGPFSFQPSEMAKLSIIVYLSAWFSRRGHREISDFYEGLLPFLTILGLLAFLIIKQPDTGTLGLIFFISISIFFAAGARFAHLGILAVGGFSFLFLLIRLAPYRMQRFLVFLNPDHDPQGAGYQVSQALIAIGSGGLLGLGLGHSRQKFNYLPEPVTDSIFAVFSEEWGLIGALVVISLFVWLAVRGLWIARNAPDMFGRLLATGIVAWIVFQALINMAAITALIPLTGIPLPFISYGGTSLVFLLAAVGILLNISKQPKNG